MIFSALPVLLPFLAHLFGGAAYQAGLTTTFLLQARVRKPRGFC